MYKLGFKEVEKSEFKLPTFVRSWRKQRSYRKNYFCFTDYVKAFDCVVHNKLLKKTFKEMEIPDHLICLLRNLHAGQEARVRIRHGTTDWFQIAKGVRQGSIVTLLI